MRKMDRLPCPQILIDRGTEWTEQHGGSGYWPTINRKKLNHILMDEGLRGQTQAHCSYCDSFPISPPGDETIDHFRPKASHPELAYIWENLFYCCNYCQRKNYEQGLLKPDEPGYEFERYFQWDFESLHVLPNEVATTEDQYRATLTIRCLKLNQGHPECRKHALKNFKNCPDCLDDYAYRDLLERA